MGRPLPIISYLACPGPFRRGRPWRGHGEQSPSRFFSSAATLSIGLVNMPRTYAQKLDRDTARADKVGRAGRAIRDRSPRKGDRKRRRACERDLLRFLTTYFPQAFAMPFSGDHHRIIGRVQETILEGGLQAVAMPRASGKTTILERAALWA